MERKVEKLFDSITAVGEPSDGFRDDCLDVMFEVDGKLYLTRNVPEPDGYVYEDNNGYEWLEDENYMYPVLKERLRNLEIEVKENNQWVDVENLDFFRKLK